MAKIKKDNYERIELTFAKDDVMEVDVYNFILKQSEFSGKGKYIKNLIYEDMKKATNK